MNKIYNLLLLVLISSCGNQTELQNQIAHLQAKNDSLTFELKQYENKFVYDIVRVKHYPIKGSQIKRGEKYYGEFVFTAVAEKDLQFGTERDIAKGYQIKDPTILSADNDGAYQFEVEIKSDTTDLYFIPISKDGILLNHQNRGYEGAIFADRLVVE